MGDAMRAETVQITGHGGDQIEAYLAQPLLEGPTTVGGVVVIHHLPGYDEATKEITRRFAAGGYLAICPHLHFRAAPGASPDDAAAVVRAQGGAPDDQVVGDIAGAVAYLRALPAANGKVGTIGFCSGGRQSVLAACRLSLDGAVDCYGAYVMRNPPSDSPFTFVSIAHVLPDLSCPLLGLFGAEDPFPSPTEVAELSAALSSAGKDFSHTIYDGAGHAFFATDRVSYRPEAATDGWRRIWAFFERTLQG